MVRTLSTLLLHFSLSTAASLVTGIAETAVLVLVTAMCLRILPAIPAQTRSRIWIGVFVAALILPLWPSARSVTSADHAMYSPLHLGSFWAVGLLGAWGLLSLVRGIVLVRSAIHLGVIARRALPLDQESLTPSALELVSSGWLGRKVVLCSSIDVDVPSVVGFFKPRILLPSSLLEKMSAEDLRQIVLHEMEHLRRNDDWTNLLQKIGLVLLPVSPVLFWIERRLCVERELACDDGVLQLTGAGKAYAICLTNLAEQSLLRRSMSLALSAWQRKSELSRRVLRILERPQPAINARRPALSAVMAFSLVAGCALLLSRTPQIIAFEGDSPVQAAAASHAAAYAAPSFRSGSPAHITLVNAIMPQARRAVSPVARQRVLPRSIKHIQRKTTARPSFVLTDFHETVQPPRLKLATAEDSQFIYAAIPMRNGWLVIQL